MSMDIDTNFMSSCLQALGNFQKDFIQIMLKFSLNSVGTFCHSVAIECYSMVQDTQNIDCVYILFDWA